MNATILFIERDIVATINTDSIINDFVDLKKKFLTLFINDCILNN